MSLKNNIDKIVVRQNEIENLLVNSSELKPSQLADLSKELSEIKSITDLANKKEILVKEILDLSEIINDKNADIKVDTPIIGSKSPIDSMGLVQLCLSLEEKAEELGFDFDWTTESAMSRSRGMFRSIDTLSDEFVSQYNEKKWL